MNSGRYVFAKWSTSSRGMSLKRDICLCLRTHSKILYHLGIGKTVDVSSFSRANERRDYRIFEELGYRLIQTTRPLYAKERLPFLENQEYDILALDSTTISCSIKLMSWALGKGSKGGVKIHTIIDLRGSIPITNSWDVTAMETANIYRNRWQIETFFKWIKQNLTIKTLWGHNENAVKIHLWGAICTFLVVATIKARYKSPLSVTEVATVLDVSALAKEDLKKLLTTSQPPDPNQETKELTLF